MNDVVIDTELVCNAPLCPALGVEEIDILKQDFRFCVHHAREILGFVPSEQFSEHG